MRILMLVIALILAAALWTPRPPGVIPEPAVCAACGGEGVIRCGTCAGAGGREEPCCACRGDGELTCTACLERAR